MRFTINVTPEWKAAFPGASAGILAMRCAGKAGSATYPEHHPDLDRRKQALEAMLQARFKGQDKSALADLPQIRAYSAYYKRFKKSYHVLQQLESVALKGRPIPSVAALVEAMFMAELENGLLTAGHDMDTLSLPIRLDVSNGGESYTLMRGQEQELKPGDMFMSDEQGIISSVIYGPDQRTRLKSTTQRALFAVYAPPGVPAGLVRSHLGTIRNNVLLFSPEAVVETMEVYEDGMEKAVS